jgi:RNA polymerase primary sigma factor
LPRAYWRAPFFTIALCQEEVIILNNKRKPIPLSAQEEAELSERIRAGDLEARNKLVECNLSFVRKVAADYQNQGLPLDDLINEGNIGLITAAERFDGRKGCKFISYAVWWIRQAINQALREETGVVGLPPNKVENHRLLKKTAKWLEQTLGREPTVAELAAECGIAEPVIAGWYKTKSRALSLDAPVDDGGGDDRTLLDILQCEKSGPEEQLEAGLLAEAIEETLAFLDEREAEIIRSYFGLGGRASEYLDQIGQRLGLTRERVRQIKAKALRRLRERKHIIRPAVDKLRAHYDEM